jgi:hypothetical protein
MNPSSSPGWYRERAPGRLINYGVSIGYIGVRMLALISQARQRGLDVTTEAYPYNRGSTRIESALDDNWERMSDEDVLTGARSLRPRGEGHRASVERHGHANAPMRRCAQCANDCANARIRNPRMNRPIPNPQSAMDRLTARQQPASASSPCPGRT